MSYLVTGWCVETFKD